MVTDYCALMENNANITQAFLEGFLSEKLPLAIKKSVTTSADETGHIDLLPAGFYDTQYSKKVNNFDWTHFYKTLDGGVFIEILKKAFKILKL